MPRRGLRRGRSRSEFELTKPINLLLILAALSIGVIIGLRLGLGPFLRALIAVNPADGQPLLLRASTSQVLPKQHQKAPGLWRSRGYPDPLGPLGPELSFLHRYQTVLERAAVNGTVLFTVASLHPDPRDGSRPEFEQFSLLHNWDIMIRTSLPAFAAHRIILTDDARTCAFLAREGVKGCVADDFTQWNGRGNEPFSRLRWHWAYMGLLLGYRMWFTEADVFLMGNYNESDSNPLHEYLTTHRDDPSNGRGVIPDIQIMSTYQSNDADFRSCRGRSEGRDVATLLASTSSSHWGNNTLDQWYASKQLRCADCPFRYKYTPNRVPGDCTCVSPAFWFVIPSPPSLRFFQFLHEEMAGNPQLQDTSILNLLIPKFFPPPSSSPLDAALFPRILLLDPRVIGTTTAYTCTGRFPELFDPSPPRLAVHPGPEITSWSDKVFSAKEVGAWYVQDHP